MGFNMILNLNKDQEAIIQKALKEFKGQIDTFESALGALIIGQHYGWRVLKIIHSPATYKKYEKLLGLSFEDICPERGALAHKSIGLMVADKMNSFWAVVLGKIEVKNKLRITTDQKEIDKAVKNAEEQS